MKVGDLIKLKRGYTSPPGLVIEVKADSTGDWAKILWPDELSLPVPVLSAWHNWRDLEVISEGRKQSADEAHVDLSCRNR